MSSARAAAVIWLLGAAVYLVSEAVAAAGFGGYSYTADYISDLGVSDVMNIGGFIVHGTLFLLGALVLNRGVPAAGWAGRGFVLAAVANGVGNIVVGIYHSGTSAHWHVVGAGVAILGGNFAAILAGVAGQIPGATTHFRRTSIGLGAVGIACLIVLIVDGASGTRVLPVGLVERGSVYSIIAWELMAGVAILRHTRRHSARQPGCPDSH